MQIRTAGLLLLLVLAGCGGGSDPAATGEIKFASATGSVDEGDGTVVVTVVRTGGTDGAASVQYAMAAGTATAGSDFTAATGTLNWADGDGSNKTITVTIVDDSDVEADETAMVTLSNATGATLGAPASATITITSDDIAAVMLSGVAATGAPIVGATLTVADAEGTTREATTGADGTYSLDVGGLVPPFLVRVDMGGGAALFSVSNAESPSVVNVHPLTDLVVRAWFEAQGTTAATAFDDPVANPPPSPEQVAFIVEVVERVVQTWLTAAGVDPADFDLIATPFDADGSGFDGVLDDTTVDPTTGDIEIDDGTTTQSVTVQTGATLTLESTISGPNGTSTSVASTAVPVDPGAADALAGIKTMLADLEAVVDAAGDELATADILPFVTDDALDEGRDAETFAAIIAQELRGVTVSAGLGQLYALDEAAGTAHADLELQLALGEMSANESFPMHFVETDGVWQMAGDGHGVGGDAKMERRIDMGQNGSDSVYHAVNVHIDAPLDTVESITISGGGIFNDTPVPASGQIAIEEVEGTPGEIVEIQSESYFLNDEVAEPLPAGTEFVITVDYVGGASESITRITGGSTDEVVLITSPTTHTLATANLGGELDVEWELPTTYAIASIQFGALLFTQPQGSGGFTCFSDPEVDLPVTATSGTLTMPTECNGEPIVESNINVSFNGVNGERIQIIYFMGDTAP